MKGRHELGGRELELKPYCPDQEKTPQVKEIFHINDYTSSRKYHASSELVYQRIYDLQRLKTEEDLRLKKKKAVGTYA